MWNRRFWFVAGIAAGLFGARALQGGGAREIAKGILKTGLAIQDWLAVQGDLLRDDVSDLYAEAVAERRSTRAAPQDGGGEDDAQPRPPQGS